MSSTQLSPLFGPEDLQRLYMVLVKDWSYKYRVLFFRYVYNENMNEDIILEIMKVTGLNRKQLRFLYESFTALDPKLKKRLYDTALAGKRLVTDHELKVLSRLIMNSI